MWTIVSRLRYALTLNEMSLRVSGSSCAQSGFPDQFQPLLLEHFTILHGLNKLQQQAINYLINTINSVKLKSPEVGIVIVSRYSIIYLPRP